jgi:hypothetical protein
VLESSLPAIDEVPQTVDVEGCTPCDGCMGSIDEVGRRDACLVAVCASSRGGLVTHRAVMGRACYHSHPMHLPHAALATHQPAGSIAFRARCRLTALSRWYATARTLLQA